MNKERLTKRINEDTIELSPGSNPAQYNNSPQRVYANHPFWNVFNKLCEQEDAEEKYMIDWKTIRKLLSCFDGSFINGEGEFVAHAQSNQYFVLHNCETELDVKCKVLEWFSRGAYKTEYCRSKKKNDEFHEFMLNGINQFLGTDFREAGIELIYARLGNACNHNKTIRFVESGYDFDILLKEV